VIGADSIVGMHEPDAVTAAVKVVAIASTLLVAHYALQGVRLRLLGHGWSDYVRRLALPGIGAEASLMPIGVVPVPHDDRAGAGAQPARFSLQPPAPTSRP
jgi:hypothetical protein